MNTNLFTRVLCSCGCQGKYWAFKDLPIPSGYEIIDYTNFTNKPLVIKRLMDGETFRLGDTIERITPTGKSYGAAVITKIQVEPNGFMQIHTYCTPSGGLAIIKNEQHDYTGSYPNLFNYIINLTNKYNKK